MSSVKCANCNWQGTDEDEGFVDLCEVDDLAMRLDPGSEVPAGACPGCGCFCYLAEPDIEAGRGGAARMTYDEIEGGGR